MKHIYLISGFGADERVFSKLNFKGHLTHFIPWLLPVKKESIEAYALRMAESVQHKKPVLVGLSFGGMMSIEIAKLIETDKVILISSVKTRNEIPLWMRVAGKLNLDKIFPLKTSRLSEPLQNYNLGIETKEELQLVREYRKNINQRYTNWAGNQVINWKNTTVPSNLLHIHGGKDHLFPLKNLHADVVIKDGGHFMIMNRANEVNAFLQRSII